MSPALIFSYFKVWWGLVLFGLAAFGVGHRIVKAGVGLVLPVEEHCLKKLDAVVAWSIRAKVERW